MPIHQYDITNIHVIIHLVKRFCPIRIRHGQLISKARQSLRRTLDQKYMWSYFQNVHQYSSCLMHFLVRSLWKQLYSNLQRRYYQEVTAKALPFTKLILKQWLCYAAFPRLAEVVQTVETISMQFMKIILTNPLLYANIAIFLRSFPLLVTLARPFLVIHMVKFLGYLIIQIGRMVSLFSLGLIAGWTV